MGGEKYIPLHIRITELGLEYGKIKSILQNVYSYRQNSRIKHQKGDKPEKCTITADMFCQEVIFSTIIDMVNYST